MGKELKTEGLPLKLEELREAVGKIKKKYGFREGRSMVDAIDRKSALLKCSRVCKDDSSRIFY